MTVLIDNGINRIDRFGRIRQRINKRNTTFFKRHRYRTTTDSQRANPFHGMLNIIGRKRFIYKIEIAFDKGSYEIVYLYYLGGLKEKCKVSYLYSASSTPRVICFNVSPQPTPASQLLPMNTRLRQ